MPKATTPKSPGRRHNPLADDVLTTGHMRTQPSKKSKRRETQQSQDDGGHAGERFVDAKMSRKILQMGQELAEEDSQGRVQPQSSTGNTAFDARDDDEEEFSDGMSDGGNMEEWADEDEEEVEEVEVVWMDPSFFPSPHASLATWRYIFFYAWKWTTDTTD